MDHTLKLSRRAETYLNRADRRMQERLGAAIHDLLRDPYGPSSKQLKNARGGRSVRVGPLRIVYRVDDQHHTIEVGDIGPRGQVYRRL